jgi:2-hydroxychromene-2-carboxylate isomerase
MTALRFYLDFVSPYTYVGWKRIHALAERHGREVEPVPIVFGAVLKARGARPQIEIPHRRDYLIADILRLAALHGVPLVPPPEHPFRSLLALRLASLAMAPAARRAVVDECFDAAWARGEKLGDHAVVARIAAKHALSLADAESDENKHRLRAQTDEALALGAFGVPTIFVDGQMFFGNDSFPYLDRFLGGENAAPPEKLAEWRQVWK